jgi:predicted NUDIX family NTP pyrophosphohydrolase
MVKDSAGILLYRRRQGGSEVLLVHPGGPFWAHKDLHAWSIPKGEIDDGEDLLVAALREFREETGLELEAGGAFRLAPQRQRGGKIVHAWAVEGDCDPETIVSNTFAMEWPPGSGKRQEFPEVDRAAWFTLADARRKLHRGQIALVDEFAARLCP